MQDGRQDDGTDPAPPRTADRPHSACGPGSRGKRGLLQGGHGRAGDPGDGHRPRVFPGRRACRVRGRQSDSRGRPDRAASPGLSGEGSRDGRCVLWRGTGPWRPRQRRAGPAGLSPGTLCRFRAGPRWQQHRSRLSGRGETQRAVGHDRGPGASPRSRWRRAGSRPSPRHRGARRGNGHRRCARPRPLRRPSGPVAGRSGGGSPRAGPGGRPG